MALLACARCAKPGDISQAWREHIFAGPHGWIDITLRAPVAALPRARAKDQLSLLEFDGTGLVLKATQPYAPATLDTVHGAVGRLHARAEATGGTMTTLTRLVVASLVLNLVVLALHLLRRR